MTMYTDTVRTGAAATRRASVKNPMEVLARLRRDDPTKAFEQMFKMWRKIVEGDDETLASALLYAYRNYWTQLDRQQNVAKRSYDEIAIRRDHAASDIAKATTVVAEKIRNVVLLDLVLPNGKALREATFRDCARAGGWFSRIAKLGKPTQIVGNTISEAKLQTSLKTL